MPNIFGHRAEMRKNIPNLRALLLHMRKSKQENRQYEVMTNRMVITNACPACASVFSSKLTAQVRFRNAIEKGHCQMDLGMVVGEVADPDDYRCPMEHCDFEAACLNQLNAHISY